jgi:hypothetical protein
MSVNVQIARRLIGIKRNRRRRMKDDGGSVLISVASPQQVGLALLIPSAGPTRLETINF